MPITPYHFGPSGLVGLIFRRWLDITVFVLANIVVDVEVLVIRVLGLGWPAHRYCHTFLIGSAVGALWGLVAYRYRRLLAAAARTIRIPSNSSLGTMVLSGILGVWLHVLIDGANHPDMRPFWPNQTITIWQMVYTRITPEQIERACMVLWLAALVVYAVQLKPFNRNRSVENRH